MSARASRGSRSSRAGVRNVVKVRVAPPRTKTGTLARSEELSAGLRRAGRTLPAAQKLRGGRPIDIGVGVIGLGFMGRTHIRAYSAAHEAGYGCRLVAVCDRSADRLGGRVDIRGNIHKGSGGLRLFDPKDVQATTSVGELLANERVELVSICTHTPSHVEVALAALAAGKHVIVEKPVSLDPAAIRELDAAAKRARRICMPAMCMRFWPGWSWLKEKVESRSFGAVKSAVFQRTAGPPGWAAEFYGDPRLTGGALFDLHIHDADMVHWLFGAPKAVMSTGSVDHVTTLYRYARGARHVVAEGGWDHAAGFTFRMRYVVVFDRATAEFDLLRDPPLVVSRDGRSTAVRLDAITGYDGEIRYVLECLRAKRPASRATLSEAVAVTRALQAERRSAGSGRPVEP